MASYRKGIEWIALNDEDASTDLSVVSGLISVLLLADLFDRPVEGVARDVLDARVTVYSAPPGEFVHLRGGGQVYHYGSCEGFAQPLCKAEIQSTSACGAPDPEISPDAKLCRKCKRIALDPTEVL